MGNLTPLIGENYFIPTSYLFFGIFTSFDFPCCLFINIIIIILYL